MSNKQHFNICLPKIAELTTGSNDDEHSTGDSENSLYFHIRKSESLSFRLDKNIVAELKREAEQKQINLNTVANQIFDFCAKFGNSALLLEQEYRIGRS